MRFILLLISLVCSISILKAQDTIRTLIISEARIDNQHGAYVELTNVGTTTIDLSQFEFGKIDPWTIPYDASPANRLMLPQKALAPGQSFVIAKISDWVTKMWVKNPEKYNKYESKPEFFKLADLQIHVSESPTLVPQSEDSVSVYSSIVSVWNGAYCWYIRHYVSPTISVVIDQVNGVFDNIRTDYFRSEPDQIGGVIDASLKMVLIRKANINRGNINFSISRGTNPDDSEWMLIPFLKGDWEPERAVFWTVGNHGDYHLNSLTSSKITINWTDSILNVPWGVRNDDSIMYKFNRVPGIAWHYDYAKTHADSAYISVRTGDKLTVYACGNQLEKIIFKINALPPTGSDNIVIPKRIPNKYGYYRDALPFCEVTDKVPGMDTISGIPFACRVDTLFKYLEKPSKATWDFVWVDGVKRADLKKGDILKVTSENGAVKQYYIKPNRYLPSHDASLSSITWPDIPDFYRGVLGWMGDTIPSFSPSKLDYNLLVPYDVDRIPALIGKTENVNAKLHVKRAVNLFGNTSDRTISFTSTAEDDTTTKVYNVKLTRECGMCSQNQIWKGEPFFSQYVFHQDYANDFLEIFNPGNMYSLDLSNYMITFGNYNSPEEAITRLSGYGDWKNRYNKYIPGYKWVDEVTWASIPARIMPDPSVEAIVLPKDVFVMAEVRSNLASITYPKQAVPYVDIDFLHNPWGDSLTNLGQAMYQWWGQKIMLFKILNDSIKLGLKAANDPKDFQLIDVIGDSAGVRWVIGGKQADQSTSWTRKPHIYKGNPVIQASFGTTKEDCEWYFMDEIEYKFRGETWPHYRIKVADGIGSHYLSEITQYKSTVTSNVYKVHDGFSNNEAIKGIGTGISLTIFYSNIIKADTGQYLKVIKASDGSILEGSDIISQGDTLIVVSSDSTNTTKYKLDLTPFSNDAKLTSIKYSININGSAGTIGNFEYGTNLKTVFEGVTVPDKAIITVIDAQDAYMPMRMLNYDTTYVNVKVNDQIRFEVIAEDGITKIVYTLQPNFSNSDAFVTSNVYVVSESVPLISSIPNGTSVSTFYSNVIPASGATMKLLDKYGLERVFGTLCKDDKLLVTAADGITTKTYYFFWTSCGGAVYILSGEYTVDQINLTITGTFTESTRVDTLISKLITSSCATVKLYDKLGNEKSLTDHLSIGDKIRVTSCCGDIVVVYTLSFVTRSPTAGNEVQIKVYPNPGTGNLYVSGVKSGNRICVYKTTGELVLDKTALQTIETISLDNQPGGVYLVKVAIKGKKDVSCKIVKH